MFTNFENNENENHSSKNNDYKQKLYCILSLLRYWKANTDFFLIYQFYYHNGNRTQNCKNSIKIE